MAQPLKPRTTNERGINARKPSLRWSAKNNQQTIHVLPPRWRKIWRAVNEARRPVTELQHYFPKKNRTITGLGGRTFKRASLMNHVARSSKPMRWLQR